ncbi:MAG TPA: HYR domain-containing protein, partial [Chitinophagaceae bacterium]|nr:HYR domain-containing protein [Chitinophagaceae bacterium]
MAAWEAAHPELVKTCATCPKKEADGGWEEFVLPTQPVPPGAIIKMAPEIPKKNSSTPIPDVPSRAPIQQWLGHTDPGSSIPPDTYGAVGLTQVMSATNDFVKIHAKSGGAQLSQVSISTFTGVGGTCDPQVFFDPSTQRWIFVAIRCSGTNDQIILMTSLTSDALGSWRNLQYVPVPGGIPDHPYLGYDDTKIVIGHRRFAPGFLGPALTLIDKTAMLSGAAVTFGVNAQTIDATAAQGDAPRPVTVYFPPFSNSGNPSPGTVYIVQSWTNSSLRLSTITGSIPACVWNTGSAIFPTAPDSWTAGSHGSPGSVQQQAPETRRLASNDSRVSSAVMMNGKIWLSQHCAFPAGATATAVTHTDVQYWQLDGTPGGTFGNVLQRGRTGAVAGEHRWFSAIAVNKNEDVIIGYSMSNATNMWPSAAYSTRQATTAANTLDDPRVYHAGEGRYWKDFGSGRARWGDYSQSHLDPADNSLWTIQEYASTPAGAVPPDNNSRYGVWWAQVPPSAPIAAPIITAAPPAVLISESCVPANGVVDPGETVTMSFCLQNIGTSPTVNAVGNLLATGGIVAGSSQNYGVIVNGGPSVCRNFTFTNSLTTCGGSITASIQVQDGAANLGTVTFTIPVGGTAVSFSENFDAVVVPALPAGWTAANPTGGGALWVTSNAGTPAPASFSAPNAAFIDDPNIITDKQLTTPVFNPSSGASVSFRNNFTLESGFDGGVLEISINGGAFVDITSLAGGAFTAGGYTGTISSSFGSLIAGRQAWTGTSGGFIISTATLPTAAAGQPVRLKFRMGSDNSVSSIGWRVDNVTISQPSCCGAPCVLTCPANMTVNTGAAATACGTNVSYAATATGLCGPITYSPASGSFFPVGTTTVNVSSASGSTCSFTVTVVDNTLPTITCPANISVPNAAGLCSAVVTYPFPSVGDNCPLTGGTSVTMNQSTNTTTITPIQIGCQSGGLTTANSWWRAYNLAPLNLPASITIKSVRFGIERSQFASGSVTGTIRIWRSNGVFPTATRTLLSTTPVVIANQVGTFMTVPINPATAGPSDIIGVELFIPEGRFAPNAGTFFIGSNGLGETAPSYLDAPDCGTAGPTPIASLVPTPLDHIHLSMIGEYYTTPPTLVFVSGIGRGGTFPVGTTAETWRVTDAAGNQRTCTFNVTVNDVEQPNFTLCPANVTRTTDVDQCYATYLPVQPTFTDNCAVTALTYRITRPGLPDSLSTATGINYVPSMRFPLNGTTGVGVSTIVYTARDAAGNTRTCTQTVTVNDGQIPTIVTQPVTKFVCVGSPALFTINVTTNGGPLIHTWQEWNGTAWQIVPGAPNSATLTIPNVSFADNTRTFRDSLTGRCTVVISGTATLYVNPLPTVTLTTSIPPSLLPGQSLNIISTVSPTGGTYQWYRNGVLLTSPLQAGPILSGITVDGIGTYKLTYTDLNGCVRTSSDIVVTGQPSNNLYIYPVPNNGQFQVRFFNQPGESATVRVFDAKGSKVYEKATVTTTAYTKIEVNLGPAIADGVYVVELVNAAGNRVGA